MELEKETGRSRTAVLKRFGFRKETQECRMSLVSHLEEFRKRLVACIICFFAAVLICLGQAAWLTERLMEKAQGFQFVTVSELLSQKQITPVAGRVYRLAG